MSTIIVLHTSAERMKVYPWFPEAEHRLVGQYGQQWLVSILHRASAQQRVQHHVLNDKEPWLLSCTFQILMAFELSQNFIGIFLEPRIPKIY